MKYQCDRDVENILQNKYQDYHDDQTPAGDVLSCEQPQLKGSLSWSSADGEQILSCSSRSISKLPKF